ncbi:phage Gp19/Gp15/Gp42 family protein [Lactobacillus iners]|jgi:hypothetical protein|uniref:phage Gp19/Gp15/Gp42 family protein n=1 Tax=Lactobacillus iners TaxID=147802 RepID=UPI0013E15976|nr:phage Gp19/Gp15/Gp42 family protein [Lactobacillus iners]MCT7775442.1 phage Gp19/Gp15/Gp42 family protein [Lactobacillus iners]MCT7822889.1 phage Gp19/Gp15/Gp42 family protein [Lactobacillus crispatus]QIH26243.1 hypothetical protein G6Z85_02485 [Lactobacillus iners]DAK92876.1 MAG TPA: hypothetical protein [Caudoviricetes sp.]
MCKAFATLDDIIKLFRTLTMEESERAKALLPIVSNSLRVEAKKVNRNLDEMAKDETYASVLKSVTVDVVARTLMTSTNSEPMIQSSESALGYSSSGTYLVPGGGLFIKNTELARLGLKRPRWGMLDIYNIQF